MNSKDYRKLNTLLLAKEVGSISALASLAGSSQSYLSQIIGAGGKRDMGDELARRLEYVCNRPHGWLDEPHIEQSKLAKARELYEIMLRFDEPQLDALATVLGFSQQDSERLGKIALEGEPVVTHDRRVTDLGKDANSKNNKVPAKGKTARK